MAGLNAAIAILADFGVDNLKPEAQEIFRGNPFAGGTKLTQHWELRNLSPIMIENGDEEVQRRRRNALDSIEKTLPAIKAAAEAS